MLGRILVKLIFCGPAVVAAFNCWNTKGVHHGARYLVNNAHRTEESSSTDPKPLTPQTRSMGRISVPWNTSSAQETKSKYGLGLVPIAAGLLLLVSALSGVGSDAGGDGGTYFYVSSESYSSVSTRNADGSLTTDVKRKISVNTNIKELAAPSNSNQLW
mmetsp:Transcript_78902/g.157682  ORF Transcript_78902/g.157682 Transcript_78902/m.157682 type:complete len:159 (-) Transcript_78902:226-702(-)|eukprot:CAMPEP_0171593358 /NCGR_PEP_ID=MMETSP0990-20121206/63_1 /TAXON_ID=483369 /ORGANISM="non described non described, Strain CCMP2098" /LENGTH=158 /DNA_ID=CAMNT_0012153875 /DNA_START=176 /DNA_END=652 /DNA_ORIENTATION=-